MNLAGRIVPVVFVFLLFHAGGSAQVIVQGIVMDDKNEERLPYANVLLKGTPAGTTTNIEGVFVLRNVPAALCTLEVRYLGYRTKMVPLDASQPVSDVVVRLREASIELREVTVVADPEPTTFKARKQASLVSVSPKQLALLPAVGEVDIFRGLQLLPGVAGTNDASSGLYVRGGAPDQNLVLFDGMTIRHVDHFFGFFSAFNAEAVKDIQFYKGGFPAKYGGVLSSVVDMTGRTGDQREFRASIGANLITANGNVEIPLWDQGSLFVAGRTTYGDSPLAKPIYEYLTGDQGSTPSGGQARRSFARANMQQEVPLPSFYDFNAKATYYITPTDVVAASLYASNDRLDRSQDLGGSGFASAAGQNIIDITDQGNFGLSGRWFHQWGADLFSNIVVASSRYSSTYTFKIELPDSGQGTQLSSNGQDENNMIRDLAVRVDNYWDPLENHTIGFGLHLVNSHVSYALTLTDQFRGTSSNLLNIAQSGTQNAVYLQDEWKLSSALTTTLGGRMTYYQPTMQLFLDPRLSAHYAMTEHISLKGAVGTYRQFMNRIVNESITQGSRDFWLMTDNVFRPGRSDHYILGSSWEDNDFVIDVEGYYKSMSGLVEFSQRIRRTATDLYTFAIGDGVSRGVELLVQKKHGTFTGWVSYSLSRTAYTFPVIQDGEEFPAAQDQLHELKISGTLSLSRWSFSANWIYGSGKPFTQPESQYYITLLDGSQQTYVHVGGKNAERLPPYHRLDVSGSYLIRRDDGSIFSNIGLSIFNLYNRNNVSYYTYNLNTSPPTITEVASLGITPTLFIQISIK